jgi:hypothetical protein
MKTLTAIIIILLSVNAYAQDCKYAKNEVDEFTGDKKVITKPELFVSHTDSVLKKYFKKKDYLTINCYAGNISNYKVVYFSVKIRSKSAYDTYGSIQKGSEIMLKTNSETITVKSLTYDSGDVDYEDNITTYSFYCLIDEATNKKLVKDSIEKIRIYWSKGYDDYPVVDKDAIKRHLNCVK